MESQAAPACARADGQGYSPVTAPKNPAPPKGGSGTVTDIDEGTDPRKVEEIRSDVISDTNNSKDASWSQLVDDGSIMFQGKPKSITELLVYFKSEVQIPTGPDISTVRSTEVKLARLLSMVSVERAKASYALGALENQKSKIVGKNIKAADRRSQSSIEAYLVANNPEFSILKELIVDCRANNDFWNEIYNMIMRAADRLKQISITLTAELKSFSI